LTQLVLAANLTGINLSADAGSAFMAGIPDRAVIAMLSGIEC